MKTGKSLMELAAEITRQQNNKRDFILPMKDVKVAEVENNIHLAFGLNIDTFFSGGLTDNGHTQLAQHCNIPAKYYDLMKGHPNLLAHNVRHWLERSSDRRMIRSLDGNIRGILSDSYRRLDNYDLAQNVLPILNDVQAQVESCEITERKFYIKAITHKVQSEVKVGDVVSAGIIIQNSEVGHGSLSIKPLIYRLVCKNGAIADKYAHRKYHAGRTNEVEQIEFSNDTLLAEDKAYWLKVRDLVKFSLSEVTFEKIVESMRESTEKKLDKPEKSIELITKEFTLQQTEKADVLKHLIEGGDLTSWGLGNAVTRMAQDVESYDRSTELESIGFQIMQKAWN